jgi:hypothetical protein
MKPLNCRFDFPPPDRSNSESSIWFRILEALVEALIIYIAFKRCRLLTFWGEKRAAAPDLAFAKSIGRIRVDQPQSRRSGTPQCGAQSDDREFALFHALRDHLLEEPDQSVRAKPDRQELRTRACHRAQRRARCSEWNIAK